MTTFLYPKARQYPFDETCEQIVRLLEARGWTFPGWTVTFHDYACALNRSSGYRRLDVIEGPDFRLWFCRIQGRAPGTHEWNDTAGVLDLVLPQVSLSVYEDGSGPTMNVYVGDNYEADKSWWKTGSKVIEKYYRKPRRHLTYTGSAWSARVGMMKFPPFIVHTTDLDREYSPEPLAEGASPSVAWAWTDGLSFNGMDAPPYVLASKVYDHFDKWLRENVLAKLERA